MKVAVCGGQGYRDHAHAEVVLAEVLARYPGMTIVHGGDRLGGEPAGRFAWRNHLGYEVYPGNPLGILGAKPRLLVAFPGTPQAFIDAAKSKGVAVHIVPPVLTKGTPS